MNILIIGNGGREHALCWKIRQSKLTGEIFVAPGNAGTSTIATNLPIGATDFESLGKACVEKKIKLLVVGPEVPLVEGIRDYFESKPDLKNILIVGPGKLGAQLEGSKDFSKAFMLRHGIATARAKTFSQAQLSEGLTYLQSCQLPIVLKADGLAAGKGVIICQTLDEAQEVLRKMLEDQLFGKAGSKVLIEQFLDGIEVSVFALTDGKNYVILPEAKDYKRIGDGDTGPNTGGMGAVSPVAFADAAFMRRVEEKIIRPTIEGLNKEGIPYRGFLFFGLISVKGEPYVIEYNARMGDPETEAVLMRIESDFTELLIRCAKGELGGTSIKILPTYAVTVVVVSGGYPGDYKKGKEIRGLDQPTGGVVFHAGTRTYLSQVLTDGGRVLAVTGVGISLDEGRRRAYESIAPLSFDGLYFRRDIGVDLMEIENDRHNPASRG